ncbi:glycosyltransferase [bacterium]|nr:glycosyltransferase [bacterium]
MNRKYTDWKNEMKIAFITSSFKPELNGVSQALYSRARYLAEMGNNILILAPDYQPLKDIYPNYNQYLGQISSNIWVKSYPATELKEVRYSRKMMPFYQYDLTKELEKYRPDIIHVDEPYRIFGLKYVNGHMRRPGIKYARLRNAPITAMWHTDYFKYAKYYLSKARENILVPILTNLFKWVYRSYDRVFCHSDYVYNKMADLGIQNLKSGLFHGIETDLFKVVRGAKKENEFRMLYVGRLEPEKTLDILFKGFEKLNKQYDNLFLDVVGDGSLLNKYRSTYGDNNNFHFHGGIKHEALPKYYSQADIFVSPSQTETFGSTVLEAAACKLPLIAAKSGGYQQTVLDGKSGIFFEPGNEADLEKKIKILIHEKELRKSMGKTSRKYALQFSAKNAAENIYKEFISLAENRIKL